MNTLCTATRPERSKISTCLLVGFALLWGGALPDAVSAQQRTSRQKTSAHKSSTQKKTRTSPSVRNLAFLPVEGPSPNNTKIRAGLAKSVQRLRTKVKVIPTSRVDEAADKLGADLTTAEGKVEVARELQIAAYVDGTLAQPSRASADLQLRVYDGRTGEVVGKTNIKGKPIAIERLARTRFWGKLGTAIMTKTKAPPKEAPVQQVARATPPPAPEEELDDDTLEPKRETRASADDELDDEPASSRSESDEVAESEPAQEAPEQHAALELGARLRVMTRSYSYNDPIGMIAQHDLSPTPALRLEARWYPGAHFTTGALANLGLDVYYQVMYPVKATAPRVGEFPTSSSALGLAARYRIPLASHELGLLAGYSNMSFDFDDAEMAIAQVPSVSYGAFKLGADARFALNQTISLGAYAAYLMVQGFGELSSTTWFPHTSGAGLELELRGGYALSKSLEATATLGLTRYALSLNPKPDDPGATQAPVHIAGGVTDQYFNGGLGIVWKP